MKAQMRNAVYNGNDLIHLVTHGNVLNAPASLLHLGKELRINFAPAKNVGGIARHDTAIVAHPLQVVWIVTAGFKSPGVPRPKALALRAEHLVTSVGLVNENLAIGTGFCVGFQKSDRCDSVGVAHMVRIVAIGLEFPAMRASVLVTGGTLPSGRDEAVAGGISAAMNELIVVALCLVQLLRVVSLQLKFGVHQICLEYLKALDFRGYALDLIINVLSEPVMSDGSLSGRKHGLFLGKENVLLVLGEFALEERLGKAEVLKMRMRELRIAKHALWNGDVFATEECLVTGTAGGLGTGIKGAGNGFAIGGIEAVTADGTIRRHFGKKLW